MNSWIYYSLNFLIIWFGWKDYLKKVNFNLGHPVQSKYSVRNRVEIGYFVPEALCHHIAGGGLGGGKEKANI